jgi:hypothetical protein
MDEDELNDLVLAVFGARGTKTNTSALGVVENHPDVILGAIQRSTFSARPEGFSDVRDARSYAVSRLAKGEWTGYHAEMLIVSAILKILSIDKDQSIASIKAELDSAAGQITICADAPCCKHCGNMLDALGINYHGDKAAAGLTGWWNPFKDKVAENGTPEFSKEIPWN